MTGAELRGVGLAQPGHAATPGRRGVTPTVIPIEPRPVGTEADAAQLAARVSQVVRGFALGAGRQLLIVVAAAAVTYGIGHLFGTAVG